MTSTALRKYRTSHVHRRERKRTIRLHPQEEAVIARAAAQHGVTFAAFVADAALQAARTPPEPPPTTSRGCPH